MGITATRKFGALLQRHRLSASLSQAELAERAGLSPETIAALERGRRTAPRPATLHQLTKALNLLPADRAALIAVASETWVRRLAQTNPVPAEAPTSSSNLPVPLSSFIGREAQIAEVQRLLGEKRLLTLVGVGGIGKTRLALEVAQATAGDYADGARLVELASLPDGGLVARSVAAALGLHEQPTRPVLATLIDHLCARQLLLVLDNCEHVLAACAQLAAALLPVCSKLRILATSRESLGVDGETTWRVPPLSLPDPRVLTVTESPRQPDAVRLFVERANSHVNGFTVTERNARTIAEVCKRLDGIPLAIELAAARVGVLGLEDIAGHLHASLPFLTRGSRTALQRQQTLRATIDWSYRLLLDQEWLLFDRLSVFAGGWTLDAAEQTCSGEGIGADAVLGLLERLVAKSLVSAETDADGMSGRYHLLEVLRQFGAERLEMDGQESAARSRHAAYFLTLAEEAEPALWGPHLPSWKQRLEKEHDNLRAALRWLIEHGPIRDSERLGGALARFWLLGGFTNEGRQSLAELLAMANEEGHNGIVRAKLLNGAGLLASFQGDYEGALVALDESMDLCSEHGMSVELAHALYRRAELAWWHGDYAAARELAERGLGVSEAVGHRALEALNRYVLGVTAYYQTDLATARALLEGSLATCAAAGYAIGSGMALGMLGQLTYQQGDHVAARGLLEGSLTHFRAASYPYGTAEALARLGCVALRDGDLTRAHTVFTESVIVARTIGAGVRVLEPVEGFARLAAAAGQPERALRLVAGAAAQREAAGAPLATVEQSELERWLAPVRMALGQTRARGVWAAGRILPMEELLDQALAVTAPIRATTPPAANGGVQAHLLTPRELEVAALVARGLTNPQIAEALVITRGTAALHVEHIRTKLGLHSHAQIAAWSVEFGLTASD